VDKENKINFRKDIYNHDKAQERAIDKKEEQLL
jgi:murein L,D-transpeptidase YcbB/YkuD